MIHTSNVADTSQTSTTSDVSDSVVPRMLGVDDIVEMIDANDIPIGGNLKPEQRHELAREYATAIITIVHRSMDWGVWGAKRLAYWDTLQSAITASAYTKSLTRFLERIAERMGISVLGNNTRERRFLYNAVNWSDSYLEAEILRVLRTETRYIVLAVRVQQENRKRARVAQEEDTTAEVTPVTQQGARISRRVVVDSDTTPFLQAVLFKEKIDSGDEPNISDDERDDNDETIEHEGPD